MIDTLTCSQTTNEEQQRHHHHLNPESILEILTVMKRQESDCYSWCAKDYLTEHPLIDQNYRRKMYDCCITIVDLGDFSKETVEIAFNILDRFMARLVTTHKQPPLTRLEYQLATMSSLYLAIKVHEVSAVAVETMASLSGGRFTANNIKEMETLLLKGLGWRMNPPTSMDFARCYLQLLLSLADCSSSSPCSSEEKIMQVTRVLLLQANRNYDIAVQAPPSKLAFLCLSNAVSFHADEEDPTTRRTQKRLHHLARLCHVGLSSASSRTIQFGLAKKLIDGEFTNPFRDLNKQVMEKSKPEPPSSSKSSLKKVPLLSTACRRPACHFSPKCVSPDQL